MNSSIKPSDVKLDTSDIILDRLSACYKTTVIKELWSHLKPIILNPNDNIPNTCSCELYISGSFRLGVSDEHSDIDTVVVVSGSPDNRDKILKNIYNELKTNPKLCNFTEKLNLIDQARIPLVSFYYKNIDFDITVSTILNNPRDIYNAKGTDESNELSLGGPRHTEFILKHAINYNVFAQVLVKIREWAKNRKIYGSKFGYLGGVSWAILVSFICNYDCSSVNCVLKLFFGMYSKWKWKITPLSLSKINPNYYLNNPFSMAIMTPTEPIINSSQTVNINTLLIITEEINRAHTMLCEGRDWNDITKPVLKSQFLKRFSYVLSVKYENIPENSIISSKWLTLSYLMTKYPLYIKSIIWPKIENFDDNVSELYMCMDFIKQPDVKELELGPVIEKWKKKFPNPLIFDLNLKKNKKKKFKAKKIKKLKKLKSKLQENDNKNLDINDPLSKLIKIF